MRTCAVMDNHRHHHIYIKFKFKSKLIIKDSKVVVVCTYLEYNIYVRQGRANVAKHMPLQSGEDTPNPLLLLPLPPPVPVVVRSKSNRGRRSQRQQHATFCGRLLLICRLVHHRRDLEDYRVAHRRLFAVLARYYIPRADLNLIIPCMHACRPGN